MSKNPIVPGVAPVRDINRIPPRLKPPNDSVIYPNYKGAGKYGQSGDRVQPRPLHLYSNHFNVRPWAGCVDREFTKYVNFVS
ncbi:hypothetical protein J6590_013229 [Homalodisca vitripennis]|nr:hypothetical protein J6590_013229 [Homalodisca vitripennis]